MEEFVKFLNTDNPDVCFSECYLFGLHASFLNFGALIEELF